MWDHFAQLLNVVILKAAIPISDCDICKVAERLPESELRDHVSSVLSSYWYSYVVAFVNTAKHRRLVEHAFSVSFEENRAGVKVGAFSYRAKSFPAHWGTEVLGGVIEVKNQVIGAGRLLNRAVCGHDA
jgi:hypothetical protein